MKIFKIFKRYAKKLTWLIIGVVVLAIVLNYVRSLIPLYIGKVFGILDYSEKSTLPSFIEALFVGLDTVQQLLLVMVCIIVTAAIRETVNVISDLSISYVSETIGYNVQTDFYNRVQELPYSYLNSHETGDLIQRSTSDIIRVKRFLGEALPQMMTGIVQIVIYASQMLIIDLRLGGILLACLPVIVVFSTIYHRKMRPTFSAMEVNEGRLTTVIQENLTGIRVVKAFANENEEMKKFDESMGTFTGSWRKLMSRMSSYWAVLDGYSMLLMLFAFVLGVIFIMNNSLNLSQVISIFLYVQYIIWPTRMMGRLIGEMSRTNIASGRILEIVEIPTEFELDNGELKPEIHGNISFENVAFQFSDSNKPTIHNINLEIKQGETIALLGKTGSGKSVLVSLLNRMLETTEGTIKIDGVDIKDIEKKYLRRNVGLVLQEPFLFSMTIAENIGIIQDKSDLTRIQEVSEIAAVKSDIERFDRGFDTMVGERGVTLSGGQKQRISIARIIVENKPILVFDDSLSAVDTETDIKIRNALNNRQTKATTIIITHRVSTAMDADRIVILEDGTISQIGTFDELIKQEGLLKNIWEIQNYFEDEKGGVN
ncbi:MAG: ABC transporter ATP-binding protein [Bacilli bacterium]